MVELAKKSEGRVIRGVPLTADEQRRAREAASVLKTEDMADISILQDAAIHAAGGLAISTKPAFYAEFWTAVALRQGTIVNAVHHFMVAR